MAHEAVINEAEFERQWNKFRKARMLTKLCQEIDERLKFWIRNNAKVTINDLDIVVACCPYWVNDTVVVTNIGNRAKETGMVCRNQVGFGSFDAVISECRLSNKDIESLMKNEVPQIIHQLFKDAEVRNNGKMLQYTFSIAM